MSHHDLEFDRRVHRLTVKHRAVARGHGTRMRPDGLLVSAPLRAQPRLSLRTVLFLIAAFFAFKALVIASAGVAAYDDRVARLQEGTIAEAAGAWAMRSDPVSEALATQISRVMP